MNQQKHVCPQCGSPVTPGDAICRVCGGSLIPSATVTSAVGTPVANPLRRYLRTGLGCSCCLAVCVLFCIVLVVVFIALVIYGHMMGFFHMGL